MKESKKLKEIVSILKEHKTSDKAIKDLKEVLLFPRGIVTMDYEFVLDMIKGSKSLKTKVFSVPSNTNKISSNIKGIKKAKAAAIGFIGRKKDITLDRLSDLGNSICNKNADICWCVKFDNSLKNNIKVGCIYSF